MEIRVGSFVGAIKAGEKAPVSARQEWQTAPTSQHAAPIPPLQIGDAKLHRHQSNRVLLLGDLSTAKNFFNQRRERHAGERKPASVVSEDRGY
ncbi:hypothetical protein KQX54_001065 [Cotesia glomerata]|uniref:Uncharacterized protein n=1 Tax=Cotesia glomerata TaxID=32391 RepID=A0AAV7HGU7_COTGL|nr:hypothetical protein KQX54_001065 [Cotesia glomerata]